MLTLHIGTSMDNIKTNTTQHDCTCRIFTHNFKSTGPTVRKTLVIAEN